MVSKKIFNYLRAKRRYQIGGQKFLNRYFGSHFLGKWADIFHSVGISLHTPESFTRGGNFTNLQ